MPGNARATTRRREHDLMKLAMSDYEVHIPDERLPFDFCVKFHGPADTPYEGGIWKVHVTLPHDYPFSSPSIGFMNRIYHPNVDDQSGSICLDVLNQVWSPMFDLLAVFSQFLPQLLAYPNPSDPLNGEAAALMMRDAAGYNERVRDYVSSYASVDVALDGPSAVPLCGSSGSSSSAGSAGSSSAGSSSAGASASDSSDDDCDSELSDLSDMGEVEEEEEE